MKGITIQQPLASALLSGPKTVESRHFEPTGIPVDGSGMWVAVHAGKNDRLLRDKKVMETLRTMWAGVHCALLLIVLCSCTDRLQNTE